MIRGETMLMAVFQQPVLRSMFIWGNLKRIIIDSAMPEIIMFYCTMGMASFVFGYIVFYKGLLPDRVFNLGQSDGKIWNSHVIWHALSSIGQIFYCLIPMYYGKNV